MTSSSLDVEASAHPPPAVPRERRTRTRRGRFFRVLVGITGVVHVPVALAVFEVTRRLFPRAPAPVPWLLAGAWAVLGVVLFAGRARAAMPDRRRHGAVVRFVDVPYFVHWCAAVWTLVPALLATLVSPLVDLARGVPVHAPMGVYMWSYLSGLVVCGYGVLVRRRWVRVVERELRIPGLDARFEGLRVAHLSDLHIGALTPKSWGLSWSRAANRRAPDVAVVTGDLVTSGVEFHDDIADVVAELRARDGVFVSMGNHDYFGEGEPLISMLRARGVRVLRNEGVVIERGGARLWLAAIDDTWTGRDDLARALEGRGEAALTVLLAHDPARFDEAADAGAHLVLSGHTHGGQIAMPFASRALSLASLAHPYNVGVYRRKGATLYVHPGLGTTGPPIRLGAAPEVTILVLRRESLAGAEP
jgi:predicted MPP superfamily phosphohydrolase